MKAPMAGVAETLAPGIRRVLAPNPSPMTYWGTNSYLLGEGEVTLIDPGPASASHLKALLAALAPGEVISQILVTHAHLDHSAGTAALASATGAPVWAYGNAAAGRDPWLEAFDMGGGEGVDQSFAPDRMLEDGAVVETRAGDLTALWTPGHFGNHLSFALDEGTVFTGDLVMGWSTSLVSPPDGDLGAFLRSLEMLAQRPEDQTYFPGHGDPIETPHARVAELKAHRLMRHEQIRAALAQAPGTAQGLAERIYTEVAPELLPAAARNVLAHLIEMLRQNEVEPEGTLSATTIFHRT